MGGRKVDGCDDEGDRPCHADVQPAVRGETPGRHLRRAHCEDQGKFGEGKRCERHRLCYSTAERPPGEERGERYGPHSEPDSAERHPHRSIEEPVPDARRGGHGPGVRGVSCEGERRQAVGDEVDEEDLDDRQGRTQPRADRDGEHHDLAKIRGEQEGDELPDVVADAAAFADCDDESREVVVGQDDGCGLPRGLGAATPHCDPCVALAQSGRVVHSVAGHGDHLAGRLQRPNELELRRGRCPRDYRLVVEAERTADRARGRRMVAGEHPDGDACAARLVDRCESRRTERIVERDDPEELQAGLDRLVERLVADFTRSDGEDTEAFASPGRNRVEQLASRGGEGHDDLGRTLHERPTAALVLVHARHSLAIRVERDLVHEAQPRNEKVRHATLGGCVQERDLDRVAGGSEFRRASRRSQDGCTEQLALVDPLRRSETRNPDLVLGQGAGLVRADDRRSA